jgi:hypothetical protein
MTPSAIAAFADGSASATSGYVPLSSLRFLEKSRSRPPSRKLRHRSPSNLIANSQSGLGEALHPSLGQRHLVFDHAAAERLDADFFGAHVQPHRLGARGPGKGFSHRWIEVHVRRADACRRTVQTVGQDVESRVHTATRRAARRGQRTSVWRPIERTSEGARY